MLVFVGAVHIIFLAMTGLYVANRFCDTLLGLLYFQFNYGFIIFPLYQNFMQKFSYPYDKLYLLGVDFLVFSGSFNYVH